MTLLSRVNMAINRIQKVGWTKHWYRLDMEGLEDTLSLEKVPLYYAQRPACAVGSCLTDAEVVLARRFNITGHIREVSQDLTTAARAAGALGKRDYRDDTLERLNDYVFKTRDEVLDFFGKLKTHLEQKECRTSN